MKNEAVVRPLLLQQRVDDDDDDHVCPMVCVCAYGSSTPFRTASLRCLIAQFLRYQLARQSADSRSWSGIQPDLG